LCLAFGLQIGGIIEYAYVMNELQGLFVAAVTPFAERGTFQPDWQAAHFAWLQGQGVDGVLVAGTNGEGPSLSSAERRAVIDAAVTNRGSLHLIAGTGTPSLEETSALSRYALEAGVDAVLVVPPFYFRDAPIDGLIRYYRALCDAIDGRMLFYHIPRVSGVPIPHDVIRAVRDSHPQQCYGIKDTGGDPAQTAELVRTFGDWCVLGGSDHLMRDNLKAGVRGQISGLANAFPELFVGLLRAFKTNEPLDHRHERIVAVQHLAKRYPHHAAIKALVAQRVGLAPSFVKPPLVDLTAEQHAALQREIATLEV
jgi:4-hydroxy-tetrahydrodipicolinate synthase